MENEKETVLTVRIVNQSAVNLYSIAVSYSVNDETLGSGCTLCAQICPFGAITGGEKR